tara:strand:- start:527 stop:865 length:339 start_codon:yes stop_codon:yes gene_type:complete
MTTLFEKIIAREIPANIEYEDDECIVIHDINPQAPIHLLIIPKLLIPRIGESGAFESELLGRLLQKAEMLQNKLNLAKGFRLVINNGQEGGETVPHLHIHLLAGRPLAWPPG